MDRTLASRALLAALLYGIAAQALLVDHAFGINLVLLAGGLLVFAVVLAALEGRLGTIDRLDLWLPPATLLVTLGIAVRADPFLIALDVTTGALLLGASMAAIGGGAVTRRSAAAIVGLGFVVLGWVGIGIFRLSGGLRRPAGEAGPLARLPAWAAPVARGLLLAAVPVVIFVALFAAADAAFDELVDRLFTWDVDLANLPLRVSVAFLMGWIAAGLLAIAVGELRADETGRRPRETATPVPQSLGAAVARPAPVVPRLGTTEAATVLLAVDAVFAAFVVLQLAWLFGGLDTLAATGLTYAEYARRGFFELVAVTSLAGLLVAGVHAVVEHRTRLVVGSALALALLNVVVLLSAFIRLRIYQEAYGWTELRFYVLATIAWLGIGIAAALVLLSRDRMGWLFHALAMSAIAVLIAVNAVGPTRFVAEQNVARLLDPSLVPPDGFVGLDVGYAVFLPDDAIPALVRALPALDGDARTFVEDQLRLRGEELAAPELAGWPAWNLAREGARDALRSLPGR